MKSQKKPKQREIKQNWWGDLTKGMLKDVEMISSGIIKQNLWNNFPFKVMYPIYVC
jgi:hypothetical protein